MIEIVYSLPCTTDIPCSLPAGFQRRGLPHIKDLVNDDNLPIVRLKFNGNDSAIAIKVCPNLDVFFLHIGTVFLHSFVASLL